MDYNNDLTVYDFSLVQGMAESHFLGPWQVDGIAFSLEDATEIRVDFRREPKYSGAPDLSLTVANGGVKVKDNNMDMIFGSNTLALAEGLYHYDVLVVKGGARYTYVRGHMILTAVITR